MTFKFNISSMSCRIIALWFFLHFTPFILAQDDSDRSYLQYLYSEFTKGLVKLKTGKSQEVLLNYNMVSERMVYEKNDKLLDLVGIEVIDTIFLQNSRFVPFGKVFYELVVDAPVSLFIQHSATIVPPGKPAGYGGTSQTSAVTIYSSISTTSGYYNLKLPSDYTVNNKPVYWIRKGYEMNSFVNVNQLLKIFPGKENDLKKFIKQNNIRLQRRDDLIRLIGFCNLIIK